MQKTFLRFLAISSLALLSPASRADLVVLKNGEKIEGRIISETATEVKMEVKVSASIVDERAIPRADVSKIEKVQPDDTAWEGLKTLQLGANSLPAAQYDRYLTPLKAFTTQYPKSAHLADVQKILAAFDEEKKRVTDGELKLDGNWLSKEQAQQERYQINGLLTLKYMHSEQARGDLISALNAFDILEKQFPNSKSYPEAVDLALKMLGSLKAQAGARLTALPAEKIAQDKAIAAAIEPSKSEMKAAAEQVKTSADATIAAAARQGLKWPPFLPKSEAAMKLLADKAGAETARLTPIDLAKIRQSIDLTEQAKQAIATKDFTTADDALKQARTSWETNEILPRLTAELAAAKLAAVPAKATPKPVAATPKPVVKNPDAPVPTEDAPPENPWLKITLGVLAAGLGFTGWRIYRGIKVKANEVLE